MWVVLCCVGFGWAGFVFPFVHFRLICFWRTAVCVCACGFVCVWFGVLFRLVLFDFVGLFVHFPSGFCLVFVLLLGWGFFKQNPGVLKSCA